MTTTGIVDKGAAGATHDLARLLQSPITAISPDQLLDCFRRGADPAQTNSAGQTPLHQIIQLYPFNGELLVAAANQRVITMPDRDGATPLHYAARAGSGVAVGVILSLATEYDPTDTKSLRTPLMDAGVGYAKAASEGISSRQAGFTEVIDLLLAAGAHIRYRDLFGADLRALIEGEGPEPVPLTPRMEALLEAYDARRGDDRPTLFYIVGEEDILQLVAAEVVRYGLPCLNTDIHPVGMFWLNSRDEKTARKVIFPMFAHRVEMRPREGGIG